MKNRSIAEILSHLTTLTRGWDSTSRIPAIERDIVLEELRTLTGDKKTDAGGLDKSDIEACIQAVANSDEK